MSRSAGRPTHTHPPRSIRSIGQFDQFDQFDQFEMNFLFKKHCMFGRSTVYQASQMAHMTNNILLEAPFHHRFSTFSYTFPLGNISS